MATIGQPLTAPEPGWKRYDDSHPAIVYKGKWIIVPPSGTPSPGNPSTMYNSTEHMTEFNVPEANGSSIKFKFFGTKVRLIASIWYQNTSTSIDVYIDGSFVRNYSLRNTTNYGRQMLCFEETGLSEGIHEIEIINRTTLYLGLDAIDIDDTGHLFHPDEVTDIKDLDIGKHIRCHYTATNNQVGVFSNLGKEVYVDGINDFIPPTSSATPNGCFYFICVDKDHLGRWKLIADRNIQHSISWDALNSAGIASGSGINYSLNDQEATIRLLTGGVSSTDKDNEWDKYIVNSDLNGTIQAGDNHVWNWNVSTYSWTSTTPSGTNSDRRVLRGYNNVSGWSNVVSNSVNNQRGFRPVLLLDSEIQKILLKDNVTGSYYYYDNDWKSLGVPENNDELNTWLSEYGMEKINGQHLLTFKQNIGNKVKFVFKLEK